MKVPLRYQNTEYDCGTTSFVNALAYLYDREDIPVESDSIEDLLSNCDQVSDREVELPKVVG